MKPSPLLFLIGLISISIFIQAHQDGCHAWHSCPSDAEPATYICGDTGHCNYCPDNDYCLDGTPRGTFEFTTPSPTVTLTPVPTATPSPSPIITPTATPIITATFSPTPAIVPTTTPMPTNPIQPTPIPTFTTTPSPTQTTMPTTFVTITPTSIPECTRDVTFVCPSGTPIVTVQCVSGKILKTGALCPQTTPNPTITAKPTKTPQPTISNSTESEALQKRINLLEMETKKLKEEQQKQEGLLERLLSFIKSLFPWWN